jgi:hypothetical protein
VDLEVEQMVVQFQALDLLLLMLLQLQLILAEEVVEVLVYNPTVVL